MSVDVHTYPETDERDVGETAVLVLSGVLILLGAVLFTGGMWLMLLGGTWYYTLAGLGLLVTGYFLSKLQMLSLYIYLAVWGGTLIWAFAEVGLDWWAQVPRLVAPTLVLLLMLASLPVLRRHAE